MQFIQPKVEIIPQSEGLIGVYKQIEIAGRTCYKSEDKITNDSCKEFVQRMMNSGHTAMLEHGTVYLKVPFDVWKQDYHEWVFMFPEDLPWVDVNADSKNIYITTNFRHIFEHHIGLELVDLFQCEPTKFHEKRVTVRFTCDRGVSHELVRHRVFSFAQESTRYCNYSKDKFGNELTFVKPSGIEKYTSFNKHGGVDNYLKLCEDLYMSLLDQGWKPQDARAILPNCLKTEVVMTGFLSDWEHFFDLRCAPNAHPDMKYLADKLKEEFISREYI